MIATAQAASVSYVVGAPTLRAYPYVYGSHGTTVVTPVQQQYHTQDELGQYAYGYSDPLSSKQEIRSLDGVTRGSYSYRDADGILQTVDYRADDTGFHVAATNLPKPIGHQSPIPDTTATVADTTNSISADSDSESVNSAGEPSDAIYSRSGLRLAESAAAYTKSVPIAAHVRTMELPQSLADTIKVAPTTGIYVSSAAPRNVVVARPLAVAGVPVATKSLLQKVYGFGYPLSKQYIYSGNMQYLIVLTLTLATVQAKGYIYPVPSVLLQTPMVATKHITPPKLSQQQQTQVQHYFTQDSLGQYSYGYSEPLSTKQEIRSMDGVTRGSYSYIDAHGLLQTVDYVADQSGFHVAATNLPMNTPQPVTDTPEVALARKQHLEAHQAVLNGDMTSSSSTILSKPVKDTVEVETAKKEFFARYALEEEKQKLLRQNGHLKSNILVVPAVRSPPRSTLKTVTLANPSVRRQQESPVFPQRYYLPAI
ncbi:uncharacterized protein LOC133335187 [Musca vetustissima]|uniref:uncharacterized protein LOC133335187 n=1 Tax=Musca vetustissima TaxID=27455 RepID=UPI002AB779A1|nr:uncharacterized protein LOC133335187 [Musca vetustissima]